MHVYKFLLFFLWGAISATIPKDPNVVIVFVVDQFPFYYFNRHQHNFIQTGFRRFMDEGIFYTKAYHAHGIPETSPGHASLSSGVLPLDHGAVSNRWFKDGKTIEFCEDPSKKSAMFDVPADVVGRSPHHIAVDTISDQMGIHQATNRVCKSYSVGIKDTATIATAGQRTPAFWFNRFRGGFTSSRHYMSKLPDWVKEFNKKQGVHKLDSVAWDLVFDRGHDAYKHPHIDNYDFVANTDRLAGNKKIVIDRQKKDPYANFLRTPAANKLILDFATECVKNVYKHGRHEKLLLWVCLSPLDLLGHIYGPDSLEVIDFVHQIDRQLSDCMQAIEKIVDDKNVGFVLTADHGVQPIQEISYKNGMRNARRIMADDLKNKINDAIEDKFKVPGLLDKFESTYFVYDRDARDELEQDGTLDMAENLAKQMLMDEAGIKRVWTYHELKALQCEIDSHEQFYKNHLLKGRLGDLIIQPQPYCLVTNYPKGCSHNTPYDYDTHIPLAFYQKGVAPKKIRRTVYAAQLSPTLAQMLTVPVPASSRFSPLPHLLEV